MSDSEEETFNSDPIGSRLKAAREAQGLSLDDIAAKTRVPIRHLHHMEKGEWDELPAPTYSVGFARAYATAVGLSPSEIGTELRAQLGAPRAVATPSYYEPADPTRVPPLSLAIAAFVILLLLIGAYLYWRSGAVDDTRVDEGQIAMETQPPAPAPVAKPVIGAPAPSSGPVVLTATSDVWLRVYEPDGRKLFENTLKAGERFEVPPTATRPQILTGRPNALNVTVNGRIVPPLGSPDKTIADVSLLPADLLARPAPAATGAVPPKR
jgi:cytoskeletal protein RodZ